MDLPNTYRYTQVMLDGAFHRLGRVFANDLAGYWWLMGIDEQRN